MPPYLESVLTAPLMKLRESSVGKSIPSASLAPCSLLVFRDTRSEQRKYVSDAYGEQTRRKAAVEKKKGKKKIPEFKKFA